MKWTELEDICTDCEIRLISTLELIDAYIEGINESEPNSQEINTFISALGCDGAIKDVGKVFENVEILCNYMFEDGSIDITDRLKGIKDKAVETRCIAIKYAITKDLVIPCHKIQQMIEKFFMQWNKAGSLNGEHENGMKESQQEPDGEGAGTPTHEEESVPQMKIEDLPVIGASEDEKQRERRIFQRAINEGYMILNPNGKSYIWNKTKVLCAYMCGRIYCSDKVTDGYELIKGSTRGKHGKLVAKKMKKEKLKKLFGFDVANNRNGMDAPPDEYEIIDVLFEENGSK